MHSILQFGRQAVVLVVGLVVSLLVLVVVLVVELGALSWAHVLALPLEMVLAIQ